MFIFVLLYVFTFLVPCCEVRVEVRIKTMFDSSLPLVVCRRAHRIVVSNILSYYVSLRSYFRVVTSITISDSSLPSIVCRRAYVLFVLLVLLRIVVSYTTCLQI